MILNYRKGSEIRRGSVMGVEGAGLIVSQAGGDPGGLQSQETTLVFAHEAVSIAEFTRLYSQLGGGLLYDEDGDVV